MQLISISHCEGLHYILSSLSFPIHTYIRLRVNPGHCLSTEWLEICLNHLLDCHNYWKRASHKELS